MFCKNCGKQLPDGTVFCTECGTNQSAVNPAPNTVNPNMAYNQPQNTGYSSGVYQTQPMNSKHDKSNVGLNILSWFVPIFGLIYYFVKKNERPNEAKGTLKAGLISIGVNVLILIISLVLIFAGTFAVIGGAMSGNKEDEPNDVGSKYLDTSDDYGDMVISDKYEITADENKTETSSQSGNADVNISSNWTDYTIAINGAKITIPMSYKEFANKTGCTFADSQDAKTTLKSNYYTYATMTDSSGKKFTIDLLNESGDLKTLDECTVISVNDFQRHSAGNADIVFAGGLRIGDKTTEAELKKLFGEPDDTWYSNDGSSFKYTYYENYDKYYSNRKFVITVYDGLINDIDLKKSV
ncbi:MAG: zinc ribbon domain-containing protein [Oscillospiraceae bacterium]|nr:zinc ribbon domain-containing protein [Oscillospiraceae bacterium]